jgi:eukaryotic-like serine/threonine-protein kinase
MKKRSKKEKKSIEVDPDFAIGYGNLALSYQDIDRLSEDEATLQRASERKLAHRDFPYMRYDIAFLRGDLPGMKRATAPGKSKTDDLLADNQAFVLAYSGHLQQARRMSQYAAELAQCSPGWTNTSAESTEAASNAGGQGLAHNAITTGVGVGQICG